MILRIELPKTNIAIDEAFVVEWHKKIGDAIEYGDDLVDLVVEKVTRLRRQPVGKVFRIRRHRKPRYFTVKGSGLRLRITALDSGTLTTIDTPEGTAVTQGSLLATMSSQTDSSTASDHIDPEAVARVVVNRVETTTETVDT